MTVIALGNTAPKTDILHETTTAGSLQTMGHSFSDLEKKRMVLPDLLQGVCLYMAKDQFRNNFSYSAEGVGTI